MTAKRITAETPEDTRARLDAREHTARGERNGNVKLTSSQVAAIRERRAGGVMLRVIAEEFAVSTTHVKNIVHGRTRAQDGV